MSKINLDDYRSYEIEEMVKAGQESRIIMKWVRFSIIGLALLIVFGMVGYPHYNVYSSEMDGKAEFVKAEENRKVIIEEAKADVEVAKLNKQADSLRAIGQKNAEIIRAEGMAEAMDIENGKLTDEYIKYLWVRSIKKGDKIYIPTESNMPLLEARNKVVVKKKKK